MTTTWRVGVVSAVVVGLAGVMVMRSQERSGVVAAGGPVTADSQMESGTGLPRLVDLGADKCIPCRAMAPILDELREEYAGTFEVIFIDVWKNPAAGEEYGVQMIPTQIFYDAEGNELDRHMGFMGKRDILMAWRRLGVL